MAPQERSIMSADLPPRTPYPADPYPPARRGKLITTVPVTEGHALIVKWPLPSLLPHWRESPEGFLGHLIGHEGEGSLFASLKEQGWLRSLSAGGMQVIAGRGTFSVSMTLTDEGAPTGPQPPPLPGRPLSAAPLSAPLSAPAQNWRVGQFLALALHCALSSARRAQHEPC